MNGKRVAWGLRVTGWARAKVVTVAMVPGLAGCFYVDPVNQRPSAEITDSNPAVLYRGSAVVLSAQKSRDPDGDALTYAWAARRCDAENTQLCENPPFQSGTGLTFSFTLLDKQPVRVVLSVVDEQGAEAETSLVLVPANRAPRVALQIQGTPSPAGHYTVGRKLTVFAKDPDSNGEPQDPDEDALTLTWTLYPPSGSNPDAVEWTQVSTTQHELRADVDGLWTVEVSAADSDGETAVATAPILVDLDQPPCLVTVDPEAVPGARYILERSAAPRRFAVLLVEDELDPYPPPPTPAADVGAAELRWQIAGPDNAGAFVDVPGHALSDLFLDPSGYAPGDMIDLRVEVADRVERALPCVDSEPRCAIAGDTCWQRLTWGVEIR
jgi:hypothetical protein